MYINMEAFGPEFVYLYLLQACTAFYNTCTYSSKNPLHHHTNITLKKTKSNLYKEKFMLYLYTFLVSCVVCLSCTERKNYIEPVRKSSGSGHGNLRDMTLSGSHYRQDWKTRASAAIRN